jgi:hypothetical protein
MQQEPLSFLGAAELAKGFALDSLTLVATIASCSVARVPGGSENLHDDTNDPFIVASSKLGYR